MPGASDWIAALRRRSASFRSSDGDRTASGWLLAISGHLEAITSPFWASKRPRALPEVAAGSLGEGRVPHSESKMAATRSSKRIEAAENVKISTVRPFRS
jgi:hypothetical protein